jgi:uncharacterized delta-60 repeat protein
MRFDASGASDQSFGSSGKVVIPDVDHTSADAVALQPDGRIVVAGHQYADLVVARFTASGGRDPDFGEAGIVRYHPPFCPDSSTSFPRAGDIAIQTDGKIVVAGSVSTCDATGDGAFLLRLKTNGDGDTKFGSAGLAIVESITGGASAAFVKAQRDDRMVVAGTRSAGFGLASALGRVGKKGAFDATFGEGGGAGSAFETEFIFTSFSAAQQPDGSMVVFGAPVGEFVLERYENSIAPPKTTGARIEGGRLVVDGRYFDRGSVVLVDGVAHETDFDAARPGRTLSSRSAGESIPRGRAVRIQVRTSDGAISNKVRFTR